MPFPIIIGLHRSRILDASVFLCAALGCATLFFLPQDKFSFQAVLSVIWLWAILTWYRLSPEITTLRLDRNGSVQVRYSGADEFVSVDLLPGATVHPWLSVFRMRTHENRKLMLLAAYDSLSKEDFRRLRVFLRRLADFSDGKDDA